MGLIVRAGTAPILDSEAPSGTEIESEFAKVFAEVNGLMDDSNISATAGISGTKLGLSSVPNAQLVTDTIETSKISTMATWTGDIRFSTEAEVLSGVPGDPIWSTMSGVGGVTLKPGSASDIILLSVVVTLIVESALDTIWEFGFGLGPSASPTTGSLGAIYSTGGSGVIRSECFIWSEVAGSTASRTYKPMYRLHASSTGTLGHFGDGTAADSDHYTKVFTARCMPVK